VLSNDDYGGVMKVSWRVCQPSSSSAILKAMVSSIIFSVVPIMDTVQWLFMASIAEYRLFPLFFVFQKYDFGVGPFLNNPNPEHRRE